ncbi:hypothetical protein QVN96_04815 [Mediterraneibacter glycyrrhizinilyticus]|uniref:hypothetical protein n=1 Tax=Mediterraneibacter glycyrrhizinilyticus TaxID=342942 RepID=UPI0025AA838D|nr:hypothetical protein [Mediterraneibacter glycyrrhizinilyticus]MDN0060744.1 hypothetical protein [Mediterraneibacter glycyrrhizinilyticus]
MKVIRDIDPFQADRGEVVMISGGAVSLDVIEFFAERNAGVSEGRNIINVLKKREYIPR